MSTRQIVLALLVAIVAALTGCDEKKDAACQILPAEFSSDATLSGCYVAEVSPVISAGVTITMEPGTEITFAKNTELRIGENQTRLARGTASNPILLTGEEKSRGSWVGIIFDTTETTNYLENVTVEYAGSTSAQNDPDAAGVKLVSDSRHVVVNMDHVTIRQSEGWGVWLTASSQLPVFTGNVFTSNTLGPVNVESSNAFYLTAQSDYTGNDVDFILVRSSYIDSPSTWEALNVPYLMTGYLFVTDGWTINPGTTLVMGAKSYIYVGGNDDAFMNAKGTAALPITITGFEKTNGYWDSIVFDTTNNSQNAFAYATVEYGGGGDEQEDLGLIVAVSDSAGVSISVTDTTLSHSARAGIYLGMYANFNDDIATSNTFVDNKDGDVVMQE